VKAAIPVNPQQSTALGLNLRKVVIQQLVPDRGVAICVDSMGHTTEVAYRVQQAKGRIPQEGEVWYVDRSMGPWTFRAFVAVTDDDFQSFPTGLTMPDGQRFVVGVVPSTVTASFSVRRANATDPVVATGISGDTASQFVLYASGKLEWGPGGSTTRDTNLYRSSANQLTTDDSLVVTQNLTVGSDVLNTAWTSWTPTWSGSLGAPSLGNGTVAAKYKQIGKTVFFRIHYVFGSSTNFGSGAYGFTLPVSAVEDTACAVVCVDSSATNRYPATGWLSGGSVFRVAAGSGAAGIAPGVPFTWDASDELIMGGVYERS